MIGEVLSPGALSVTESLLKPFGLSRFHHRPGVASSAFISPPRGLISDPYRFGRFWKDKDDVLEGLEEMAQKIDPTHWKRRNVLPFWMVRVFVLLIAGFAGFYPRTDRSSLLRSRKRAGRSLLRRIIRLSPMRQAFKVAMTPMWSSMRPSRGRNFCKTPEDFGDLFARIFSKGSK